MPFYQKQGKVPSKRHVTFYQPDGKNLYREELYSTRGFSGVYANRYRIRMPTRVLKTVEKTFPTTPSWTDVPLQWHLFHTDRLKTSGDFFQSRTEWMHNDHVSIQTATPTTHAPYFYKNGYAHELIFIHRGAGRLCTEFGEITFTSGDYLIVPKGVIYQLSFDDFEDNKLFIAESSTPFDIPAHYRSTTGQLLESAPYCERDLRTPLLQTPVDQKGEFEVLIKAGKRLFVQTWDHHPFDVVGWDGCEFPYALNIKDFAAKVGQIHLPPTVHLVFTTEHFVVCNFVPRLLDFHAQSVPAPYFHTNVDSDEVLYYVDGTFTSRKGIESGSITLHPTGIPHGPQPGKTEASIGKKETNEYAVMIDTFSPLYLSKRIEEFSDRSYSSSWLEETF